MTDMTPADFQYRLASVAGQSMPDKAKLDVLGIDVSAKSLPSWAEIDALFDPFGLPAVKTLIDQIAFEAMWRTAQTLARQMIESEQAE